MAAREAGVELQSYNVLFKIVARTQVVDGPSGGAALALLAYSEFTHKKPRGDMAVTGTIERDGSVGGVGGILDKVLSLRNTGVKLFLIPRGQTKYQGRNIAEVAKQFNVQVVEVQSLKDVIRHAYTPEGTVVESKAFSEEPLVLQKIFPPSVLNPLKQISLEDLASLEKMHADLASSNSSSFLRESIMETLNQSRYYLDQGYYYTAANDIFVTKLSVDSFKLEGTAQIDFMRMAQLLENDAKTIVFANESIENIEWAIAAKLRYYWGLNKVKGIKQSVGLVDVEILYSEYAAAKSWFDAAKRMNDVALREQGSTAVSENAVRDYAKKLIDSLNESQDYVLDSEIEQHYSGALAAFKNGDFSTSAFDALFALALANAGDKISNKIGPDFNLGLRNSTSDLSRYNSSIWAQYYFAHSLYSLAEHNRSTDFVYLVNAIKLQELSEVLRQQMPFLKGLLLNQASAEDIPLPESVDEIPASSGSQDGIFTVQTKVTANDSQVLNLVSGALIAIGILLLVFLVHRAHAFRRNGAPLSPVERIEKIDELLMRGKISERNWEILHERYFKQIKEKDADEVRSVARKKKKR